MSRVCQITGKNRMYGHKVSHSNVKTKRTFEINLFAKRFFIADEKRWVTLKVSAAGMRTINKLGINEALKKASAQGFYSEK